jgi:hypothetical protein
VLRAFLFGCVQSSLCWADKEKRPRTKGAKRALSTPTF